MPFLAYVAFAIIALAVLLYVLMDGWDLGVGILFLLAAREQQRDEMMESIAPFWDGNETWLVFGGVTLFAAFPAVYASTLQALYLPVMVMLFALVFRGISFEFRSHSKGSVSTLRFQARHSIYEAPDKAPEPIQNGVSSNQTPAADRSSCTQKTLAEPAPSAFPACNSSTCFHQTQVCPNVHRVGNRTAPRGARNGNRGLSQRADFFADVECGGAAGEGCGDCGVVEAEDCADGEGADSGELYGVADGFFVGAHGVAPLVWDAVGHGGTETRSDDSLSASETPWRIKSRRDAGATQAEQFPLRGRARDCAHERDLRDAAPGAVRHGADAPTKTNLLRARARWCRGRGAGRCA